MKILIRNKTHWRDDHIRSFVKKILPRERASLCKRGAPPLLVRVVYNRGGKRRDYVSGCAAYHSNWIQIQLASGAVDRVDLAHTIAHELAHSHGVRHTEMTGDPMYTRTNGWRDLYDWANSLPLERQPKPSRPAPADNLAHAEGMLARARTRAKRAATIERKWRRRVDNIRRRVDNPARGSKPGSDTPEGRGEESGAPATLDTAGAAGLQGTGRQFDASQEAEA